MASETHTLLFEMSETSSVETTCNREFKINSVIDSDLCIEVQECIEGNVPITIEYEDFLEAENSDATCRECKYHI